MKDKFRPSKKPRENPTHKIAATEAAKVLGNPNISQYDDCFQVAGTAILSRPEELNQESLKAYRGIGMLVETSHGQLHVNFPDAVCVATDRGPVIIIPKIKE